MTRQDHAVPGFITSLAAVAIMDVALRVAGLDRTISFAKRLAGSRAHAVVDHELSAAVAHRLATAAAFYPRRALCLEQSLALFVLLRRVGVGAVLKIGVQPLPFYAHAWVEVDGQPLNEQHGRIEQLATFQLGV
jgi:hypothetical protein